MNKAYETMMNEVSEQVFESGLLGTVLLDANDRVVARKGPLVAWVAMETVSGCLPFLVGYEDMIADVRHGQRGLFTLPNVSLRFCPDHREHVCTIRAYPGPRPGQVALLFQDVSAVAELEQRVVQTSNELEMAQRALVQAKEEAEAANRAKSNFLGLVSHELRTPLNVIIGNAEILREGPIDAIPAQELDAFLTDIRDNGEFLLEQINDLLDLAKIESGRLELCETEVELASVLEECLRTARAQPYAAGVEFHLAPRTQPMVIRADRQRLKQVFINLLTNAAKSIPDRGTVTATCRRTADDEVCVEISDSGVGMAPEDVERALRPFVQVGAASPENTRHGVGLGLPLAEKFTQMHGGAIHIASEPGAGTTVTVALPAERLLNGKRPG